MVSSKYFSTIMIRFLSQFVTASEIFFQDLLRSLVQFQGSKVQKHELNFHTFLLISGHKPEG